MSMYTTAQLLAANEKKFKFDPLFLRLFFRESYPFTTEKVYLSQIPGLVNMALYVSPIVSGEVIRSRGGSTSEFTPGYVKPKHEVNPQMTLRRLPDEDPQNLADPAYRRRRIILQNMRDEELTIAQVEEMQAVSAVLKGKYTMTGEAFDPVEVDMGRSVANNITQSGGTEWSKRDKSTYDPTDDIEAYALNASGVVNIIVFDPKGWALFRSFKAVKEKLDTRRGSNSELETAVKDPAKRCPIRGCMAIRRSSCIPDSTWKTTSKRTSCRTTRWCWGTLRHAVCAPMAAFRMRTHSAKVLTPLPATRKTG